MQVDRRRAFRGDFPQLAHLGRLSRHPHVVLSAEISWRQEPGINRAYVWFSDGTIAGYRDLDTGKDRPTSPDYTQLMDHVLSDWLRTHA